jgi:CRP-like cAMP-binding protein
MSINSGSLIEGYFFKSDLDFANLPINVKTAFLSQMVVRQYKKGQNIFSEGTYPAGIYFIKKGKVKKYKTVGRGKEQIIYISNEGELLGYAPFLSDEKYPDSASTITDALIGFISEEKIIQLLHKYDELSKMLMKNISHEFGVMINYVATFTRKTVRERVALSLLILNEKFSDCLNEKHEVEITLTREDFANLVGTATETLVRILHDFKEEQLIRTQGRKITVKNIPKLLEIADLTEIL